MEASQQGGFPGTLDLSGADTSGFDPIPSAWYDCIVYEITHVEVEGADGKLAQGTPGINVQFKVDGGQFDNRRVFNRYWIPNAEQAPDADKRNKMLGMLARFFMALGWTEEQVKSSEFNLIEACAEAIGKECKVNAKHDLEYDNNKVVNVKARGGNTTTDGGLL